jgi:hypothetical protein
VSTALHLITWLGDLVPRVDDPWPSHIGVSFPFTAAGAGSVLGGLFKPGASAAVRDHWATLFSFWGFWIGALIYVLAFLVQLGFG